MTQISDAKKGILTDEMKHVAKIEGVSEEFILNSVAKGTIVIPGNVHRDIDAAGIGAGLRTKVNATVGTSTDIAPITTAPDTELYDFMGRRVTTPTSGIYIRGGQKVIIR